MNQRAPKRVAAHQNDPHLANASAARTVSIVPAGSRQSASRGGRGAVRTAKPAVRSVILKPNATQKPTITNRKPKAPRNNNNPQQPPRGGAVAPARPANNAGGRSGGLQTAVQTATVIAGESIYLFK